jgi:hypothetical protein
VNHLLDESCLDEAIATLSGSSNLTIDLTLCEGLLEIRCRPLDGRAVCAAMTVDGVLWVVIDLDKRNAVGQAREMLQEWRTSYLQPTVTETASGRDELSPETDSGS